jgi:hypothetical protein
MVPSFYDILVAYCRMQTVRVITFLPMSLVVDVLVFYPPSSTPFSLGVDRVTMKLETR